MMNGFEGKFNTPPENTENKEKDFEEIIKALQEKEPTGKNDGDFEGLDDDDL